MSQETWGCFEHAVNVQLPILSAFWGDAGNLALPVGQERNRNIFVHIHPIGSTVMSQMNPRHRNGKNTKGYKHTGPTLRLSPSLPLSHSKAVTMLNCLMSLKLLFCCKIEIVWILGCSSELPTALLARWKKLPYLQVHSQSLVRPIEFFNSHI